MLEIIFLLIIALGIIIAPEYAAIILIAVGILFGIYVLIAMFKTQRKEKKLHYQKPPRVG